MTENDAAMKKIEASRAPTRRGGGAEGRAEMQLEARALKRRERRRRRRVGADHVRRHAQAVALAGALRAAAPFVGHEMLVAAREREQLVGAARHGCVVEHRGIDDHQLEQARPCVDRTAAAALVSVHLFISGRA